MAPDITFASMAVDPDAAGHEVRVMRPIPAAPFFMIGHSTRSIEEFAELLREAEIRLVADVRSIPRSRTNPQFDRDVLPGSLARYQVGYEHIAELGGRRGRQKEAPSPNGFWENASFRNYADHALGPDFARGLTRLRAIGMKQRVAIMCAEAVWWRCHRRIIADYLIASGADVFHILAPGRIEPARLTSGARPMPTGQVLYPG